MIPEAPESVDPLELVEKLYREERVKPQELPQHMRLVRLEGTRSTARWFNAQ